MFPTTGYTPEMDERKRLRTEIKNCIQLRREALNRHPDLPYSKDVENYRYWYNRAVNAIVKYREYRDNERRQRLTALLAALEENPPMEQALEIIDEVAEITNALQRDGELMSDYGDARRERNNFQTQL